MELRRSPSGPLINAGGAAICYRPGAASEGPNVATWAEVEDAITAADGFITVYVDDSIEAATVPADADTECFERVVFLGANISEANTLTVADGGVIRNPGAFGGLLTVQGAPSTPFIVFDGDVPDFLLDGGAIKTTGGTSPAINVPNGQVLVIRLFNFAGIGDGTHAAIDIDDGGTLELLAFNASSIFTDSISGSAASGLVLGADDTVSTLTQTFAALLSTPVRQRASIAALNDPAQGNTASRPTGTSVATGQMYFDTQIGKPVWWTGATWVLATGVPG